MDHTELLRAWRREEQQPFVGWDFPYLDGRMLEEQAPWSYSIRAAELLRGSKAVVDLGTGGGERLLELQPYWPARVVATEDYPPNIRLAAKTLLPYGASVVEVQLAGDGPLPFGDGAFDLVLNRHSDLNPDEIARVLAPGGTFLTQQVHGRSVEDLIAAFGREPQWAEATPQKYLPGLEAAGLVIVNAEEWQGALRFTDVGAIVYYLKAVPWPVPSFSVDAELDHLLWLQDRLEGGQPLAFVARTYLIEAQKLVS